MHLVVQASRKTSVGWKSKFRRSTERQSKLQLVTLANSFILSSGALGRLTRERVSAVSTYRTETAVEGPFL